MVYKIWDSVYKIVQNKYKIVIYFSFSKSVFGGGGDMYLADWDLELPLSKFFCVKSPFSRLTMSSFSQTATVEFVECIKKKIKKISIDNWRFVNTERNDETFSPLEKISSSSPPPHHPLAPPPPWSPLPESRNNSSYSPILKLKRLEIE